MRLLKIILASNISDRNRTSLNKLFYIPIKYSNSNPRDSYPIWKHFESFDSFITCRNDENSKFSKSLIYILWKQILTELYAEKKQGKF